MFYLNIINKTRKGFTLIEICVVFSILIIVIGVIYPFFTSNTKTMNETETRSDLQQEGQYAIRYIIDKAMEAQKITKLGNVTLSANNSIKLDNSATSSEIEFNAPDADVANNSAISYYFILKDNSLYYQQKNPGAEVDHSQDKKIADDIDSIEIQTIDGKNFSDCTGLIIKILLSKNQIKDYMIESKIYFRNVNDST